MGIVPYEDDGYVGSPVKTPYFGLVVGLRDGIPVPYLKMNGAGSIGPQVPLKQVCGESVMRRPYALP